MRQWLKTAAYSSSAWGQIYIKSGNILSGEIRKTVLFEYKTTFFMGTMV
ncbi:hypothetical protein HMPREF6485_0654 [Segatella buccae ATCC 33574]|uniref:Uncharacterized protein n=1 Tax=Segatella buccae ATCC 33574 TaxID=873513 RepID=E6K4W8_9BACT|nr:hypothetical protein HMPREF6485_0654 [Segatella buccae ATCC 33574]